MNKEQHQAKIILVIITKSTQTLRAVVRITQQRVGGLVTSFIIAVIIREL